MTRDVKDYVKSCYDCNPNKSSKHWKYGLLQPLPIPPLPWHSLSMDLISQLPLSNGYDAILTTCTSSELADLFVEHVFSKHGLPDNIFSDCGSLLVSPFGPLCSDRQTGRVNQILKKYLLAAISRMIGAFAYKNATHSSTQQSPFQTLYGRTPTFDPIHVSPSTPAYNYHSKIKQLQEKLRINLKAASQRYKQQANKLCLKPPSFNISDSVWLDTRVTCQTSGSALNKMLLQIARAF
ncbi:uncharacterized protein VP01_8871g1, partial [Puccinia sorghi]